MASAANHLVWCAAFQLGAVRRASCLTTCRFLGVSETLVRQRVPGARHRAFASSVAAESETEISPPSPSPHKIPLPTNESCEELLRMRHTCAHVMAMAVQTLYPDAKVTIGPWIEKGFYYDFDLKEPLSDKDLKKIKKEMDRIIGRNLPLRREEVSREEAKDRIMSINEKYKLEILEDIKTEPITIYHIGNDWWDLCAGPLKVPASLTGKPLSSSPSLELTGEVMSRDRCLSGFMELLGRRKSSSNRFCAQVPVLVDQHGCNGNVDINFHYTGFPLGAYEFNNLLIGTYIIEAHHPRLDINVIGSNEVQLGWGMGEVDDIFMIPGYGVEGRVMSKGIPVLGVQVFLHSSDVKDMECPQGPGRSPLSEQALCHATSDVEGRFKFAHVPCGSYNLVPFYKGENTIFGVSPAALDISVAHHSILVEEGFQVTGFSVGGQVIDSNGHGIAKVKIYIDSVERLMQMVTSTRYNITAAKEHYQFTSLKDFMVLPNMASIPSIQASQYQLCGSVRVAGQYGRRQVALTHGPSDVKPQTKRVDEDGNFCFVPPGEYRLSPIATAAEQKTGLLFSPQHLDVVVAAPVFDIVFLQAQVSISGHVKCKSQCSPGISIVLVDTQGGDKIVFQLTDTQNHFKFENVLPGQYKLEVTKEGGLGEDEWCWEQKVVSVDVTSSDIEDIVFVQKGYWLRIKATHPTKAFIVHDNKDPVPLEITSGWQKVCVESPGIHELHFLWACVSFGAPIFSFDTSNPRRINLVAQKYLLSGHIDVYSPLYPGANKLEQKLLVEVWNAKDGKPIANIHAHLFSEANETSPIAVYEYVYWARLGDALSFVPRYARDQNQSEQILLFYPREQNGTVAVDGCQPQVRSFAGRPAVYVTGSIVPALEAVNIVITAEKESKIGRLKAGEVAMKVVTGDDGVFAAGPLYDDTQYMVHADKQGYHFKPFGKNSFQCQKLAQILVNIIAGDGAEEILPSVLLSLSGDDGYRKNAVAPPGGKFAFDGMFPGSFYLRPLLKEYSFSPPAQALELLSGATLETTFIARRTAYSIYGRVSCVKCEVSSKLHCLLLRSPPRTPARSTSWLLSTAWRLCSLASSREVILRNGNRTYPWRWPASQNQRRLKGRLRLVSKMAVQTHKFHSDVLEVDFAKRNDIFLNSVKFYAEEYHHKQDLNAPPVLPMLIGVCVIGLFTAMPSLKDGYQRLLAKDLRRTSQRKRN